MRAEGIQRMTDRQSLIHAIEIFEAQRTALGNAVVDTTIAVLKDELAAVDAPPAAMPASAASVITVLVCAPDGPRSGQDFCHRLLATRGLRRLLGGRLCGADVL